ncbi:MAG TPA: hypothetical protein H9837_11260 [Candidatus Brachybacterium merdigallinarum]|nr:hypothetical protein [Candidatus Brachybacterium merdigallinarum]
MSHTVTAHVLLESAPSDLSSVLGTEYAGAAIPPGSARVQASAARDATASLTVGERITSPELTADTQLSPGRDAISSAVTDHRATLTVESTSDLSPADAVRGLCEALYQLPQLGYALLWLPFRHQVTSQVLFEGKLDVRPESTFFWTSAMWSDPEHTRSHGIARGLGVVGGHDLQVTSDQHSPQELFGVLEDAVAAALREGELPEPGDRFALDGMWYITEPGTDVMTDEPVLQLRPTGEAADTTDSAPEEITPYAADPEDHAWYLLLSEEPSSIGEPLREFMPNFSAHLEEEGAMHASVPYEDEGIEAQLQVIGRIEDPALEAAAALAPDPAAARARIAEHRAAVRITAHGEDDRPSAVTSQILHEAVFGQELSGLPEARGVWVPVQERFEAGAFSFEGGEERFAHLTWHHTPARGEQPAAVYTRGLARYGQPEICTASPEELDPTRMGQMLVLIADDLLEKGGPLTAGLTSKAVPRLLGTLYEVEDPITSEPALGVELTPRRKKFLGLF